MWQYIEDNVCPIPDFIKIILNRNGFDNLITFKDINEQHIHEIENYVKDLINSKNTSPELQIHLNEYLNHYHVKRSDFKLTNGHKLLLFHVKKFINENRAASNLLLPKLEPSEILHPPSIVRFSPQPPSPSSPPPPPQIQSSAVIPTPPPPPIKLNHILDMHKKPKRFNLIKLPRPPPQRLKPVRVDFLTDELKEFHEVKLLSSVNGWITKSSNIDNAKLVLEVKIVLNSRSEIEGLVQCSYCHNQIKVQCNNNRWIVTNYSRHFHKHTKPEKFVKSRVKKDIHFRDHHHHLYNNNNNHLNNHSEPPPQPPPQLNIDENTLAIYENVMKKVRIPKLEVQEIEIEEPEAQLSPKQDPIIEEREEIENEESVDNMSVKDESTVGIFEAPVSTHVLDICFGRPAADLLISYYKLEENDWTFIFEGKTNDIGRLDLMDRTEIKEGCYKIKYHIREYFLNLNFHSFYPYLEIPFYINNVDEIYRIPLFMSPFGFSSFRGF